VRRLTFAIAALVVAAWLGWCALLYFRQDALMYYPTPAHADARPTLQLDADGARVLVSVHQAPGQRAVLYFGGNAEDVARSLPQLAGIFPGRAVYALHYRGYGGSTGTPSERALVADGTQLFDTVYRTHADVTLVGRSLGSGVAIQVAAARPAMRLVLVTPYDSIAGVAAEAFPAVPVRWLLRDSYDSDRFAPRITVPATLVAAGRDTVVPPAHARRLLATFRPGLATLTVIPGVGHDDISADPRYAAALRAGGDR